MKSALHHPTSQTHHRRGGAGSSSSSSSSSPPRIVGAAAASAHGLFHSHSVVVESKVHAPRSICGSCSRWFCGMTTISCSRSTKNAVWVGLKTGLVLLVLLLLLLWRFCTPDGTAPEPHQQQHWWRGGPTTTTSTLLRWVSSPQQEQAQVESDRDLAFGPPQPIQTRPTNNPQLLLPGSYRSVEEMMERSQGRFFPSVDDRVRIYMSNWYIPPCAPQPHDVVDTDESDSPFSNFVQYNYWPDPVRGEPLLVLREMLISESTITTTQLEQDGVDGKELSTANSLRDNKVHDNVQDSEGGIFFDPNRKNEYSSGNNNNTRTFLLDAQAIEKGSRLFYLSADAMRKCSSLPCFDTVHFLFPSLHRTDMSVTTTTTSSVDHTLRQQLQNHPSRYPGNALDPLDGNSIGVVPILLQFGDLDVTRSYCPATHLPERFPATPLVRKFRGSVSRAERHRVTTTSTTTADYDDTNTECYPPHARAVPTTRLGERHLQPIISKLTYNRHFGMLDEIPAADIPWGEKVPGAIWRGALTGMKRNGFRVVQTMKANANNINDTRTVKQDLCMNMQRCKLVYQASTSSVVNASLVGVATAHAHNTFADPIVPEILDGVRMYGPRATFQDMLRYKAVIMLEGNDISSGLKWALYSNSVVLAQQPTYTSWAMEECLEPWIHYIPLADDLSDVEEKAQWVIDHDAEAQTIAHAGSLWISDLVYHPQVAADEATIFDETFRRYQQHFAYNPALTMENMVHSLQQPIAKQ